MHRKLKISQSSKKKKKKKVLRFSARMECYATHLSVVWKLFFAAPSVPWLNLLPGLLSSWRREKQREAEIVETTLVVSRFHFLRVGSHISELHVIILPGTQILKVGSRISDCSWFHFLSLKFLNSYTISNYCKDTEPFLDLRGAL